MNIRILLIIAVLLGVSFFMMIHPIGDKPERQFPARSEPTLLWEHTFNEWYSLGPSLSDDGYLYAYIGTNLYSFDPKSGSVLWERLENPGFSNLAIGQNGNVHMADSTGIVSIRPDGSKSWEYKFLDQSSLENAEEVYFDYWLQGLNLAIDSSGKIYAPFSYWSKENGQITSLVVFDAGGNRLRELGVHGPSLFLGPDDTLYIGQGTIPPDESGFECKQKDSCSNGFVIANANRDELHVLPLQLSHYTPTIGKNGILYVPLQESKYGEDTPEVIAIDKNGELLWSFDDPNFRVAASPISIGPDGTLYLFVSEDGNEFINRYLISLSSSGELLWRSEREFLCLSRGNTYMTGFAPVIAADGAIYISSCRNSVLAYNPDGTLLWEIQLRKHFSEHGAPHNLLLDSDGILYFFNELSSALYAHDQIVLTALDTGGPGLADSPWPTWLGNNRRTAQGNSK